MAIFAAAFAVLVGALGFSRGAPWLGSMLRGESCPFAGSSPDREQLERHRRQSLALRRGPRPAMASPALAFDLGRTTRRAARAWLEKRGGCCTETGASALSCEGVVLPGELAIDSLYLELDPEDRVVAVDLFRRPASGHRALAQLLRTESDLVRRVGAVTGRTGRADAAYVEERPLRRVASDFRYDTYLASISAMNFGGGEIRVRETYQSLPIAAR
jgi:hypothetical protein